MLHVRMKGEAPRRNGHGWPARLCLFSLREIGSVISKVTMFVAILAVFAVLALEKISVQVPFLSERIEERIEARMPGSNVEVGGIVFSLGEGDRPAGLTLINVALQDGAGNTILTAPAIRSDFSMIDLVNGKLRPQSFSVSGAKLYIQRDQNGRINLALGEDVQQSSSPSGFHVSKLVELSRHPVLEQLDVIDFNDVTVSYEDQLTGNRWSAEHGRFEMLRSEAGISGVIEAGFSRSGNAPTHVFIRAGQNGDGTNSILAEFIDASPVDIADHVSSLDWLRLVDARAKGNLTAEITDEGTLTDLNGVIAMGQGEVRPPDGQPIAFDSAKSYFTYDPAIRQFSVDRLSVDTAVADLDLNGKVTLGEPETQQVNSLTGQMHISELVVHRQELFQQDLSFEGGQIGARVTLSPFRIDIGQLALFDDDKRLIADGSVIASPDHWQVAVDLQAENITKAEVMEYWPLPLKPKTRNWLSENILDGEVQQFNAGIRFNGGAPELMLDARFANASARVLKTMPIVEHASGRAVMAQNAVRVTVDHAETTSPTGEVLDVSGTVFEVADASLKPAIGVAHVKAEGAISDLLALVDLEPLGFVSKLGQNPDFAEGLARVAARLEFPLKKDVPVSAVLATAEAELQNVTVPSLIPGRPVFAEVLNLEASNSGMSLAGVATISETPIDFEYTREFGPTADPISRIAGDFELSTESLARFGAVLPNGILSGSTRGNIELALEKGQPTRFELNANLTPTRVFVPALGYVKGVGGSGEINLTGTFGDTPTIDTMALQSPGLLAEGRLDLASGGGLNSAEFTRLRVGGWLDAPVKITPNSRRVEIGGGRVDLRNFNRGSGSASQDTYQITISAADLIVTDGLSLRGVNGDFATSSGGIEGRFGGQVNGGARISGIVQPGNKVFLYAEDGGRALKDAGLFEGGSDGTLRVALRPDRSGGFKGQLLVSDIRVRSAPVLAEILSVASIVGAYDALSGSGVSFSHVESDFRILPERIVIDSAHAVSPSLGVTMNGTFAPASGKLDLEGVVSPFYFVNGVFEKIPVLGRVLGGRNGEGLIGVNYALAGSKRSPRVSVNPVSGLTPGALREIFQRRPEEEFSPEAIARQKQ